jgi:Glycosyltransferase family 87
VVLVDSPPAVTRRLKIETAALWVAATGATTYLAFLRIHDAWRTHFGADFLTFVRAGRQVASGGSPYTSNPHYVYPPLLALFMAPFAHVALIDLWHGYIVLIVVAPIIGVGVFVASIRSRIDRWMWPIAFGLCNFTLLFVRYWPLGRELYLGQTDSFVFMILVISTLCASRSWTRCRAGLIGLAALVKVWPVGIGLALFQRGQTRKFSAISTLVAVLLIAPIMALALSGGSGLSGLFDNVFRARQQDLVNDSVWGAPKLLFSYSGFARPLLVSTDLQVLTTIVFAAWVVGLLVLTLLTKGDTSMCTWNVTFCVILLLPVSHRQYAIYVLPLVWLWAVQLIHTSKRRGADVWIFLVMLAWWVMQLFDWPYYGSSRHISSARYCIPFICDIVACTASVVGARYIATSRDPTVRQNGPVPENAAVR